MPLSFSNKVPSLYNEDMFRTANSTPAISKALQKKMAMQPLPMIPAQQRAQTPVKSSVSTTPTVVPQSSYTPPATGGYTPPASSYAAPVAQASASAPATPPAPVYVPPAQAAAAQKKGKEKPAPEAPTFEGIIFDLIKKATQGSKNVEKAREDLTKFQQATSDKIADIKSEAIPLEFQQGRAQVVQQASAEKEAALQTGVQNALTSQQQELAALQGAAGLATPQQLGSGNIFINPITGEPIAGGPTQVSPGNVVINPLTGKPMAGAPTQVPYQNQFLDPITGKPVGGGAGLGGGTLDVNSAAQQVINGQMSPSQAYDLFGNNLAFNNAINQEILKANPNFNFIQAEANAAAQGQALAQATERGGDLQKRGDTVIEHIAQLQTAYKALKGNTPSPYLNVGINFLKGAYPSEEFQAYLTALDNVRGELAGIFSVGGTPSEGEAMAKRILPDGATPAQVEGALNQAKTLIEEKIRSYSTPTAAQYGGAGAGAGSSGSGSIWDW